MNIRGLSFVLGVFYLLLSLHDVNAVPGDFDADGTSDLSLGLVDRSAGTTAWLTRPTNGSNALFWTWGLPGDAFVSGRFHKNDSRYYPGIVYVRSTTLPLEWYIKNPAGTDAFVKFGLPGDIIPNQGDWDGDGMEDLTVVRNIGGQLKWYVALSGSGGAILEYPFGLNGDKVGVSDVDGDGRVELIALRSGYVWFIGDPYDKSVVSQQWGLAGDIHLLPTDVDGDRKADFVISRRTGSTQLAYIKYGNGATQNTNLGLSNSIPQMGYFVRPLPTFAWSQRDSGFTGIRRFDGGVDVFKFGVSTNAIIRADGTVVQPTEDGTFGNQTNLSSTVNSTSFCPEILSVTDAKRFIYKQSAPIRSSDAAAAIIGYRKEPTLIMNSNISSKGSISVFDKSGNVITTCPWASAHGHAGGRARCTAQTASVRRSAVSNTGSPTILFKINSNQCVSVPDAGRCYGSVKGPCNQLIQ